MKNTGNEIKAMLAQFHGTELVYKIPLIGTTYTDGISYLAKAANCFWLVTDASVIAHSLVNRSAFITIDFKKVSPKERAALGYEAIIEYSDGNDHILETHTYHITDFPLESIRLFFTDGTLMLPSEY